jgi:hypothetical protein
MIFLPILALKIISQKVMRLKKIASVLLLDTSKQRRSVVETAALM